MVIIIEILLIIVLSDKVFNAMNKLLQFNYKNIYNYANSKEDLDYYRDSINKLFYSILEDLNTNKESSNIYKTFIKDLPKSYYENTDNKQIVIDYIAGMTDDYFVEQLNSISVN